jgi:prepilin-type N-terminal cleavage/methylation domain-containing protein
MLKNRSSKFQGGQAHRRGFTLIELLVVISIIATLMSLILPAIQSAREAGRRTQCLNNIRNVTLSCMSYASSSKGGHLPNLSYYPPEPTSTSAFAPFIEGRSWVVDILPYIDQQSTYDRWDKNLKWDSTAINANGAVNLNLGNDLYIEALACPNDESAFATKGGLSYVANAGFADLTTGADAASFSRGHTFFDAALDWNSTLPAGAGDEEDSEITFRTGVFWANFSIRRYKAVCSHACFAPGKIYDGSTNTLMLAENINAGLTNWANPSLNSCGFIYPIEGGGSGPTDTTKASKLLLSDATGATKTGTEPYPNQMKTGPEGQPYPNSNHPGIVVVSFCDGGARTLSEDIDKRVYTKLMTPDATRLRQLSGAGNFVAESPLSADAF